jgi:hypothetical protein
VPEQPDLAERTLSLDLGKPPRRREESKIMADLERYRPEILGAFYDLAAEVLRVRATVTPAPHRMADFFRTVTAVDEIRGGNAAETFLHRQNTLAEDTIEASPVASAVQRVVMGDAHNGWWRGTTGSLLIEITPKRPPRWWPSSESALRSELERLAPALELVGIVFSHAPRQGRKRQIILSYEVVFDTRKDESPEVTSPQMAPSPFLAPKIAGQSLNGDGAISVIVAHTESATVTDDERASLTAALVATGQWEWADGRGYLDLDLWPRALKTVIRRHVLATGGADLFAEDLEPEQITTDNLEAPATPLVVTAEPSETPSEPTRTPRAQESHPAALAWRSWSGDTRPGANWHGWPLKIAAWCDPWTGVGITEQDGTFHAGPTRTRKAGVTLRELLEAIPGTVERGYLTGPRPGGKDVHKAREWWTTELPGGWDARDHYLPPGDAGASVGRFTRPDGSRLVIHRAEAAWSIDPERTPTEAAAIMGAVGEALRGRFGADKSHPGWMDTSHLTWLDTATATGRELARLALPRGCRAESLTDELQDLIRSTTGQARIQLLHPADMLEGLHESDMRFAYSGLVRELPIGPARLERVTEWNPQERCRVRARFTVPADWSHLGIIAVPDDDPSGGWTYPNDPGEQFTSWADGAEAWLALEMGWKVEPLEVLHFAGIARVLDGWADRITKARDDLTTRAAHDELTAKVADGARDCLRAVILFGIGGFVGRVHPVTCSSIDPEAVPVGAIREQHGGRWWWPEPGRPVTPGTAHPEWSAAVWARCRTRVLRGPAVNGIRTGALTLPFSEVVAIRTDAIYTQHRPAWDEADDGKAARFTYRGEVVAGPCLCPLTVDELLTMKEGR